MFEQSTSARDPRCRWCGRPVIGSAVYGNEGPYHPACVQPEPRRLPAMTPENLEDMKNLLRGKPAGAYSTSPLTNLRFH